MKFEGHAHTLFISGFIQVLFAHHLELWFAQLRKSICGNVIGIVLVWPLFECIDVAGLTNRLLSFGHL